MREIERADFPAALRKFREVKQEGVKAGPISTPPFDPIFKSDNAQGNNSSNTKILTQIMLQQKTPDQATRSTVQLVAWSVDPSTDWIWWHPSACCRRLPFRMAKVVSALRFFFKKNCRSQAIAIFM